ncbi:MAG: hypothetical protein C0596_01550 [Marinilabiliales bacterium]|nr:MAG: hypothetical protein C0596_01550 [Marinilabiliales bacterium]
MNIKLNILLILILLSFVGKAQTVLFSEDFGTTYSSTYLLTNWCSASSYSNSSSSACDGYSWYAYGSADYIKTNSISIQATGTTTLTFDYKFNQFSSYPVVSISTVGCYGTYTSVLTLSYKSTCYNESIDLSSYAGQSVNIQFYTYNSSGTFIIDNVQVENVSGGGGTTCSDVFTEDFGSTYSSTYLYTNWCSASSYSNSSSSACDGYSWYAYGSADYVKTNSINIPATGTTTLYFDYKFNQFSSYPVVSISTGGCYGSYTSLLTLSYNSSCYTESIDLSAYAGQSVNIQFYTYNSSGTFILDNIQVENCTSGGGGGNILYEEDFLLSSPDVASSSGWFRNSGTTYACTGGDYAYYSSGSSNYFATSTFHVPRGQGININFDMKRSSGTSSLAVYARIGGYSSFNYSTEYRSGWMKLNTSSLTYSTSCSNFTLSVPGDICGGQDISICFEASGSYITIDNIEITDGAAKASVPDISSSPLTYDFDSSTDFYGPVSFDQFDPSATSNKFSYHSRYGCNNSTGAYSYISSSGGNGGQVNVSSVSGGCSYIYKETADCNDPTPNNIPSIITREFNTYNCSGSSATLRFAYKYSYSGGYTFDEDYTIYCPEIYYHQTYDGSSTGYSWTQANVNYYFADGNWWYATTDLPKAENLIVAFAANSTGFDYFYDIKISCKDCDINDEVGGTISCTSDPGLSEYVPDTEYTFTIGATTYATYYKWIVRDLTSADIYYGTTAGANPAIVSGQGTQTATINFGSAGGTSYRVMCIPYDSDYGTDASPTDACYAKLSMYSSLSEEEVVTPVSLIDFTSLCIDNKVNLFCETASELNNDYFIIQRSKDAVSFHDIAKIEGSGTSNLKNSYNIETEQEIEEFYYRIKQVDFDGKYSFSDVILAKCDMPKLEVFPNPNDGKRVFVNSPLEYKNIEIIIIDVLGKKVFANKCDLSVGQNRINLSSFLFQGTYFISVNSENGELLMRDKLIVTRP